MATITRTGSAPSSGSGFIVPITVPATANATDTVFAVVSAQVAGTAFTPPTGWTAVALPTSGGGTSDHAWLVRPTGAFTPGQTYNSASLSISQAFEVLCLSYQGRRTVVVEPGVAVAGGAQTWTLTTPPPMSTNVDDVDLVVLTSRWTNDSPENGVGFNVAGFTMLPSANIALTAVEIGQRSVTATGPQPAATITRAANNTTFRVQLNRVLVLANQLPSAPTQLTPANGEALNRDIAQRFSWEPQDPDVGDVQFGAQVEHRPISGSTTTRTVNGPNAFVDVPAGDLAAGSHEWRVRTSDEAGYGNWSGWRPFSAATPPAGPVITSHINNQTVGQASTELVWTGTGTSFEADVLDEAGTVVYTSGEQPIGDAGRRWTIPLPVNSSRRTLRVREKSSGVFGVRSTVSILVSYTPPAKALGSLAAVRTTDYLHADALALTMIRPAPGPGEPTAAHLNVWVTALGPGDRYRPQGIRKRIATLRQPGVFTDHQVVSGVPYGYQIESVASNGTTSMSALIVGASTLLGGGTALDSATLDTLTLG